jgi:hypothetical protein
VCFNGRADLRIESQVHFRKCELQNTSGAQVLQQHRLTARQVPRRLLVHRRAVIESIVEVVGQEGKALRAPIRIIGPRELDARRPVARNRPEAGGLRARILILDVGKRIAFAAVSFSTEAAPDRIARITRKDSVRPGRAEISSLGTLVFDGNPFERQWTRHDPVCTAAHPIAVTPDAKPFCHGPDLHVHEDGLLAGVCSGISGSAHQDVSRDLHGD